MVLNHTPIPNQKIKRLPKNGKKRVPSVKKENLSFFDALKECFAGARVARKNWDDKEAFVCMRGSKLMLYKNSQKGKDFFHWIISMEDTTNNDWYVK